MRNAATKVLAMVSIASLSTGCGQIHSDRAMPYITETHRLLIEHGLCSSERSCSEKELVFWGGEIWKIGPIKRGGVTIDVYKVSDATLAKKIIERCRTVQKKLPDLPVTVTVYANAHIDNLHPGKADVIAQEKIGS
jgi:hypothetical protein